MRYSIFSLWICLLIGCSGDKTMFGESFPEEQGISVVDLRKAIDKGNAANLLVQGEVASVCQATGCWLTFKEETGEEIRVVFKDYGFFVPKNIKGKKVLVKGEGSKEITSVADLKHYAKDNGQSDEEIAAITTPLEEYLFTASGVKLLP